MKPIRLQPQLVHFVVRDLPAGFVSRASSKAFTQRPLLAVVAPIRLTTASYGLSMNKVAMDLRLPVTRIAEIVGESHGITSDTALRFARYFKTTPEFWMNSR